MPTPFRDKLISLIENVLLGEWREADHRQDELEKELIAVEDLRIRCGVQMMIAQLDLLQGQAKNAISRLEELAGFEQSACLGAGGIDPEELDHLRCEALLGLGDLEGALACVGAARQSSDAYSCDMLGLELRRSRLRARVHRGARMNAEANAEEQVLARLRLRLDDECKECVHDFNFTPPGSPMRRRNWSLWSAGMAEMERVGKLAAAGDHEGALLAAGRSLALMEAVSLREGPLYSVTLASYALIEFRLGRKEQAIRRMADAMKDMEETELRGSSIADCLLEQLANSLTHVNRWPQALWVAEQREKNISARFGEDNPLRLDVLDQLVEISTRGMILESALKWARERGRLLERCKTCDKGTLAEAFRQRGELESRLRLTDEALRSFDAAITMLQEGHERETERRTLVSALALSAEALWQAKRFRDTEIAGKRCADIVGRTAGATAEDLGVCSTWVVRGLSDQNDLVRAASEARQWAERFRGVSQEYFRYHLEAAVGFFEKLGRTEDAERARSDLDASQP